MSTTTERSIFPISAIGLRWAEHQFMFFVHCLFLIVKDQGRRRFSPTDEYLRWWKNQWDYRGKTYPYRTSILHHTCITRVSSPGSLDRDVAGGGGGRGIKLWIMKHGYTEQSSVQLQCWEIGKSLARIIEVQWNFSKRSLMTSFKTSWVSAPSIKFMRKRFSFAVVMDKAWHQP